MRQLFIDQRAEVGAAMLDEGEEARPVDRLFGSYTAIWNAYARIVADASETEKDALFVRNAERIYRI